MLNESGVNTYSTIALIKPELTVYETAIDFFHIWHSSCLLSAMNFISRVTCSWKMLIKHTMTQILVFHGAGLIEIHKNTLIQTRVLYRLLFEFHLWW